MPVSILAAINLLTVLLVLVVIPVVIWLFMISAIVVTAPFITVYALLKGEKPEENAATVAFWEAVAGLLVAVVHFHVFKL